jgi:hypothetical protein
MFDLWHSVECQLFEENNIKCIKTCLTGATTLRLPTFSWTTLGNEKKQNTRTKHYYTQLNAECCSCRLCISYCHAGCHYAEWRLTECCLTGAITFSKRTVSISTLSVTLKNMTRSVKMLISCTILIIMTLDAGCCVFIVMLGVSMLNDIMKCHFVECHGAIIVTWNDIVMTLLKIISVIL